MKEPIIQSLFPTPVYKTDINRLFTNDELNFVQSQKNFVNKNDGNVSSSDNYILNRKELKNIKKFLDDCCKDYLEKIICPKENIKLYITQSWLNYTEENQFHHMHEHPNSIISGVLYFNSDEKNDKIKFTRSNRYQQIVPLIKTFNIWNSHTWWFSVKSGELILFPSSTTHQVDVKQGTNTRISLAFNTFYKGKLGKDSELTELIL
tara:strand:+ start:1542 stop:2159 length:618 start_codon:yes stop_codon:yes gene_type:complete